MARRDLAPVHVERQTRNLDLVDADDYDWLTQTSWNYGWHKFTPWKYYAKRNVGPARSTVYMAREIMIRAEPNTEAFYSTHVVDHIDGNSLHNRKANLRWATDSENRNNRIPRERVPSLQSIVARLTREAAAEPSAAEIPW